MGGPLDRVGMQGIELPVLIEDEQGVQQRIPAHASAFVNLINSQARGIHMSRLFIKLQETLSSQTLTLAALAEILRSFVESHKGLSTASEIHLSYDHMVLRNALISDNKAWRSYPVRIKGLLIDGKISFQISVRVAYSSTCPCSAALARQLIQEAFRNKFTEQNQISTEQVEAWLGSEEAICATPHSQRSYADIDIVLDESQSVGELDVLAIVDGAEGVLQTVVQAAVKREDEQEFARLNGENLMFCEDAARKLQKWLNNFPCADFRAKVSHVESLHPHDAVSIVVKGIAEGLKAE